MPAVRSTRSRSGAAAGTRRAPSSPCSSSHRSSCAYTEFRPGRFADAGTPAVGIALAISRVGCFLHGCCVGTPYDAFWCVRYPRLTALYELHRSAGLIPSGAARTAAVHPLPLYFAAAALLMAALTAWLHRRKRYDWQVTFVGVLAFGATTAILEPFRQPYREQRLWRGLPHLEWIALGVTTVGAVALLAGELASRRRGASHAGTACSAAAGVTCVGTEKAAV